MRYYGMDPSLVEIYNIRNIESIKSWDFVQNDNNKMLVVPGIMILYDGGKSLNLCARDKYFDIFVKKVAEVYKDEKNNILEDALTDPFHLHSTIAIDEKTRMILESGDLEKINNIYRFYQGKEAYDHSLFFQIDEVKSLIKIVKYHLQRFFLDTDKTLVFNEEFSGFRENYVMHGEINGIEQYFPLTYEKTTYNRFLFWVNGLVSQNLPIKVEVSFQKDKISVEISIEPYQLKERSEYVINNGIIKEIRSVERRGLNIRYENRDLEFVRENPLSNIANMDEESNLKWFRLPWGALYGLETRIDEISSTEKIIEIQNMYLDTTKEGFVKREYYSKNYKRNKTVTLNTEDMILEDVQKNILGTRIDREGKLFVMETSFADSDTSGDFFNSSYGNRYFYHGCSVPNGIEDINKEKLIAFSRKQNITNNSDLVNKYKVLKLVEGE